MPSGPLQIHLLLSLLLLTSGQRLAVGRRVAVPRQDLQTPSFDGESFERFGGVRGAGPVGSGQESSSSSQESSSSSEENSAEMREQLRQLLGEQLANAFAPLASTTTPRRPGIVAPSTGAEARAQFADASESNEEEEGDGDEDEESSTEEPTPQPVAQPVAQPVPQQPVVVEQPIAGEAAEEEQPEEDYNAWRDNFYDLNEDGSYVYGYAIPHGVRRWEKGYHSEDQHGRVVQGFYVQPRHLAQGLRYELRCYIADSQGYHALPVEYLLRPPRVQRDEEPQVNCFKRR